MRRDRPEPLYRKVNTSAHGVRHRFGGDYREDRRRPISLGMKQGVRRGLDYTPLFRFLQSKVGQPWNDVHREAVARLDRPDPLDWIVARTRDDGIESVRTGESTYFSGLYVDEDGILRKVAPQLSASDLEPSCACCTHTLDGVPFTRPWRGPGSSPST